MRTFDQLVVRTEKLVIAWMAADPMYRSLVNCVRQLEREMGVAPDPRHGDLHATLKYTR